MFTDSILIKLSNNMTIECDLKPIRIQEFPNNDDKKYIVSGKFVNLENNENTNVSITKTLAFDLKTSLMREPDHYILSVTAKYDYSQTNASSQSYSNIIDGINS